jgi:two-component system cell cycle sensor histidine kinase/response regulator CckA
MRDFGGQLMASFSRVTPAQLDNPRLQPVKLGRAADSGAVTKPRFWTALVTGDGVILALEGIWPAGDSVPAVSVGSSYYSFLAAICGRKPERAAAISAGIRAVAVGGEDSFTIEFPCRLADWDLRLRLTASRNRDGDAGGVLLIHQEADTRGEPLIPESDEQAHKMEALGRLTSGVAHDFANLLTLISGYSEIVLARLGAQDSVRPELEEIRKAATRGAGVTAKILEFIRSEVEQPTAVNLNNLVADLEKLLRPIIGEHIAFETVLSPDLGAVTGDPAQMSRVIMNLVLNARDAMPRGGRISISTANLELPPDPGRKLPAGRYVVLTLGDTGTGMDTETLSHIFEPYFTTKKPGEGTGLGLSTVYGIISQAHGDIGVRSEPGKGTVFTVYLPRTEGPNEAAESPTLPRGPGAGTETILLAEDEDSVRKLIKHLLTARGYKVLEAVNGSEALRVFEQHAGSVHLLLTDMIMPGVSGRELAQRVLERNPDVKVIYMSGYTDDMLLSAGALGPGMLFLRKPLKPEVLASRIREVLDGSARR